MGYISEVKLQVTIQWNLPHLQLNKFQQAQNRHIVTIEHHYNTLWRDWGWKRQMSSRGIQTRDLAIHDDRRFWPRFSGILGALVKWLSSRTYAQVPLLEEVSFFMVWFDPDLPVLHIHLNNTGPTARLTARCYRARLALEIYCFMFLTWIETILFSVVHHIGTIHLQIIHSILVGFY